MSSGGALTFHEFVMQEPLPLATIHDAVLEFLQERRDAAVFGAQAVNAYTQQPRMTQDLDILSTCAEQFTEELRQTLSERFHIAVRISVVSSGGGYRLYQVRTPKNRHLVDVRSVGELPSCNRLGGILVPVPSELIYQKLLSMVSRPKSPKGTTDKADLQRLLLAFPTLKAVAGEVSDRLRATGANQEIMESWYQLVAQEIVSDEGDDEEY